jgi:hypothetical protein
MNDLIDEKIQCDGLIPNPHCSKCDCGINTFWPGCESIIKEHVKPGEPSRNMKINLCTRCYTELFEFIND